MTDEDRAKMQRDTVARIHALYGKARRLPTKPREPPDTTLSRCAARYANLCQVSLTEAAVAFGVHRRSVGYAWYEIYPGQKSPRAKHGSSKAEIAPEPAGIAFNPRDLKVGRVANKIAPAQNQRGNQVSAFCAICTATVYGEVVRQPLGRGDAPVVVCEECESGEIREPRGTR